MAIKDLIFQGIGNSSIPFLVRRGLSAPAVADLTPSQVYTTERETRGRSFTTESSSRPRFFSTDNQGNTR